MDDYIKRSDILGTTRLLDTDIVRQDKVASWLLDQILYDIEHTPAADVEHVIHCKDCAKDGLTTCPMCWIENHTLEFINHDPNFYCGAAERK